MPILQYPRDFRRLQKLAFCYLCGKNLAATDRSKDHIPPKAIFNSRDRINPLILTAHKKCNSDCSVIDNQMGLLLGLKTKELPKSASNKSLNIVSYPNLGMAAVEGLDVEDAVKRWVRGFHAALYLSLRYWSLRAGWNYHFQELRG